MGFVKSPEEVRRIQAALSRVRFTGGEVLSVRCLTDPEVLAALLPPGLEPAGRPVLAASVSRFAGGSAGPFNGATISLAARHGDVRGAYSLAMYMDADAAILFGRGLYGEPKKGCAVGWERDGDRVRATITRDGVQLITLDVRLEAGAEPATYEPRLRDFNYKSVLAADGAGLDGDPALILTELTGEGEVRHGEGTIALGGTVHDPLHELPVGEVLGASLVRCELVAVARELCRVPAEAFVPHAYGQLPDWAALLDATAGAHAAA